MRFGIAVLWLLLLNVCALQASTLKGVVLANEEGGSALAKVKVSADGANLTETGESGRFILQFPNKQPGDTVQVSIAKPGYAVVNWLQLKVTLPKDAESAPVTLLICKEAEREEWRGRFYLKKSWDAIEQTFKKRLEEANQQNAAAMEKLRGDRDQAKADAEKAAAEFARQKPGDTTDLYAQAMSLFLNGKAGEALLVLDEKKLQQSLEEARRQKMEAEKTESQAIQAYLLKARLLSIQFRFSEAEKVYRAAAEQAPDSFDAHFAYGAFSQGLNHFDTARVEYLRALEVAQRNRDDWEVASTYENLGNTSIGQHETKDAGQQFEKALIIFQRLADTNPELHLRNVAGTKLNLGIIDSFEGRGKDARQKFQDVVDIYQSPNFGPKFPQDMEDLASTFNSLGAIDRNEGRVAEARQNYQQALEILQKLEPQGLTRVLTEEAAVFSNLGLLDIDQNRTDEARQHFENSLLIYWELYNLGAVRFADDIARVQEHLSKLQEKGTAK